jgi:hypothetical protein
MLPLQARGGSLLKKTKIFFFMPLGACSSSCYKQAKAKHKKNKILFFMAPLVIPLLVPRFYYYFYPLPATFKTNFVFKKLRAKEIKILIKMLRRTRGRRTSKG